MKIPYNELQLKLALISLFSRKDLDEAKMIQSIEKLGPELQAELPESKKDFNEKVSQSHGITTEQLVNSPNYELLCDEYFSAVTKKFIKRMAVEAGMTEIQAWACYAKVKGKI